MTWNCLINNQSTDWLDFIVIKQLNYPRDFNPPFTVAFISIPCLWAFPHFEVLQTETANITSVKHGSGSISVLLIASLTDLLYNAVTDTFFSFSMNRLNVALQDVQCFALSLVLIAALPSWRCVLRVCSPTNSKFFQSSSICTYIDTYCHVTL